MTSKNSGLISKLGTMFLAGATGLVSLAGCEAPQGNRNTSPYAQSQHYQQTQEDDSKVGQAILGGMLGAGLGTVGLPANMNPVARAATEATTRGIGNGLMADASRAQTNVIVNGEYMDSGGVSIYEKEGYVMSRLSKSGPEKTEKVRNYLSKLSPEKRAQMILKLYGYCKAKEQPSESSETNQPHPADEKLLPEYNFSQLRREFEQGKITINHKDAGYLEGCLYGGITSVITSKDKMDLDGDGCISFDELKEKKRNFREGERFILSVGVQGPVTKIMLLNPEFPSNYEVSYEVSDQHGESLKQVENGRFRASDEKRVISFEMPNLKPGVYNAKVSYWNKENDSGKAFMSERTAVFQVLEDK